MQTPLDVRPIITNSDIVRGSVTRYFAQNTSTKKIYEINVDQHNVYVNNPYYITVMLPWIINGNRNTDIIGGRVQLGALDKNTKIIEYYNKKMPGLNRKLRNPLEYFVGIDNKKEEIKVIRFPTPKETPIIVTTREYLEDFQTFKYFNDTSITLRPDALSLDYKTAFTLGPVDIADTSEGLFGYIWKVRADASNVWYAKATVGGWESEQLLFSYTGSEIVEIDAAFEQLGRINVTVQRNTGAGGTPEVWIYWFDPLESDFVFENFGSGRTPRISLDDWQTPSSSDVLVFYIDDTENKIRYRVQRERFDIVNNTPVTTTQDTYLEKVGLASDYRYRVTYSERNTETGKYELKQLASRPYPILKSIEQESYFASASALNVQIQETLLTSSLEAEPFFASASTQNFIIQDIVITSSLYDPEIYFASASAVTFDIKEIVLTSSLYDPEIYFASASALSVGVQEILITSSLEAESYFASASIISLTIDVP